MAGNPVNFPVIPQPQADVGSLLNTTLALKRTIEMLTGTDTQSQQGTTKNVFAAHVFVQMDTPTAINKGDLWVCTGQNYTFNVWDGTVWLEIVAMANVPAPVKTAVSQMLARTR